MNIPSAEELAAMPPEVRAQFEEAIGSMQAPRPFGDATVTQPNVVTVDDDGMPIPQQAPAAEPSAAPVEGGADWEHKYKTLQGKYNAERRELEEERRRREVLEEAIALSRQGGAAPKEETGAEVVNPFSVDLDQFREELGDQVVDMQKAVLGPIAQRMAEQDAELRALKADRARSATDEFNARINQAVPDWESVYYSDEFAAFRRETDMVSGATHDDLLNRAIQTLNADAAIALFTRFRGAAPAASNAPVVDARSLAVQAQAQPKPNAPTHAPVATGARISPAQFAEEMEKMVNDMTLNPLERAQRTELLLNAVAHAMPAGR